MLLNPTSEGAPSIGPVPKKTGRKLKEQKSFHRLASATEAAEKQDTTCE